MAGCGGCGKKRKEPPKHECPLCKEPGNYVHYLVVEEVVQESLKHLVVESVYYVCHNASCDVVFFDQGDNQCFLISDINFQADFHGVTKSKDCGQCTGGSGGCGQCSGGGCNRSPGEGKEFLRSNGDEGRE